MKSIKIMPLIIVALLLYGCYEEKDRAIVHINLSGMPIAREMPKRSFIDKIFMLFTKEAYAYHPNQVKKLHLVAWKNDSLIALRSLDISEVVVKDPEKPYIETTEFEVPEGENIIILVLAEAIYQVQTGETVDEILYYGKAEPLTLVAGKEASVNIDAISMGSIVSTGIITVTETGSGFTWTKLPGATGYIVYDESDNVLQDSQSTSYIGSDLYYLKAKFSYIDRLSSLIYSQ
ncbi:MAG TPA: hypothetical protein PK482_05410 [Spirochaetota bacterium]|nr:hypothetical protein [Spirochaetota bacterium]